MPSLAAVLDPASIFSLANLLALASWLALASSPYRARWSARVRWAVGRAVPLVFAAVYVLLFAAHGMAGGGFDSIAAVQRLMAQPGLLTAGWLHYLAFDLFVGAWIAERAGVLGLPHALLLPLLALTFAFGPAGLLAFNALAAWWSRRHPRAALG